MKRFLAFSLIICMMLSGCGIRARVPSDGIFAGDREIQTVEGSELITAHAGKSEERPPENSKDDSQEQPEEKNPEEKNIEENRDLPSSEDSDSDRKEFSSDASGEVSKDAETLIAAADLKNPEDNKSGGASDADPSSSAPVPTGETGASTAVETEEDADKTITETKTAESAESLAPSDDAPAAENMLEYYGALLDSGLGDVFECKRFDAYMESTQDYVTVFKDSAGHRLILQAGAYDVSAKLLEEDLTVDDAWLKRKNPGAVIKIVESSVLGPGVGSTAAAKSIAKSLLQRPGIKDAEAGKSGLVIILSENLLKSDYGRMAAAVYMAKAMYPSRFADVDADEALRALLKESSGSDANGIYVYVNQ